jgi:uncharacterized repeat protein (TIGR01451 family)/fimbrial isopeptide formation D2 family protein
MHRSSARSAAKAKNHRDGRRRATGISGLFWYTDSPTKGFRSISALLALTIAGFSVFGLAGAANATTTAVHEITANWVGNPAAAPYGQAVTSEWHISTNDATNPQANNPVSNVRATLTATNGAFSSIPSVCKTSGVSPISAISANGTVLLCNLGTVTEGTASVIQAPVRATGPIGSKLSVSGTATSDSAVATVGPVNTSQLQITGSHGMDLVLSAPNQNYQQTTIPSRSGGNRPSVVVDYGIAMTTGSVPGPSTYTFTVDIAVSVAGQLPGLQWEGCAPVDNSAQATGIPYSASSFANRTNAPTCSISGSGTHYTVTLSGLDYSLQHVPTVDSLGNTISSTSTFIASGQILFTYTTPITNSTGVTFGATPSQFTFVDGVTQPETTTSNDVSGTTLVLPGAFAINWQGGPTVGRSPWDANLWAAPGTAKNLTLPWPAAGTSTNPGPYSASDQPLASVSDSVTWSTYSGAGGANLAGSCNMFQNPAAFTPEWADFAAADGASYTNITTAHLWYRTDAINTKTETCGEAVGVAGSPWIALPLPAGCATQTANISPAYSDDQCIVSLPAGVTAVKMTWNPAVDKQFHHILRVWGYVPTTAPIGAESWDVGAFNAPYNVATAFPGYPTLNNYVNFSTNTNTLATIPGSTYGPNTNGQRDAMRIQGPTGVITKTTPSTTAQPGVPVTYNLTAEADLAVTSPPNQTFTVTDTLPTGMSYVAGSGTPAPTLSTNGSGQQVLSYTFTNVPANTAQAITYQAQIPPNTVVAPGTVLTNTAEVDVPGDNRPAAARQATASVTVPNNGATTLGKSVESNVLSFYGDSSAWDLTINSQDPVSNSFTDTIDVLPKVGDGRGTNTDGTYTITGITAPTGSTIYYSSAPLASLSNDPRSASNGGTPGSISGNTVGWSTTAVAHPTAIRVIAPALAPGATQSIRIAFTTAAGTSCTAPAATDNKPGQVLVNSALSIAGHTALPMLSSATTTIGNCYALDLKKYVLTKGGNPANPLDWRDANTTADYQQYAVGDTVPYKITVTNKGTGTLTNIPVTDSLVPGCDFTVASLATGASASNTCSSVAAVGTTVNTASATVTPPTGPTLTPSDPAGIVVPAPYQVVKTSVPAAGTAIVPGSKVTYTVTISEPPTSAAPSLNPTLTDDLSGVLDDATYDSDVVSSAGTATVSGSSLSWSAASIMPGQSITITYSVTVNNPDAGDKVMTNTVTSGTGSNCVAGNTDPNCLVTLDVESFAVAKSASVSSAAEGQKVTYTIAVKNTGTTAYTVANPATFTDSLAGALDDATYNNDASGGATFSSPTVSWSGALAVGATQLIAYSVTVNSPDTGDHILKNTVTPTGDGGACATPGACTTSTPVASYTVSKTASPASTTPGGTVVYTVTVKNTGQVAYTAGSPASFTDSLTGVLDDATYNGDASAGATYAAPTISWSGALAVGAVQTVTYSVTVTTPDTGDHLLKNAVTPTGTGGTCAPGACQTNTPVGTYTVAKTASVASTTPGSTITYTIVVTNTGQVAYTAANPATITDNLTGLLDDAIYNGDASGGATYTAPTISWSGALAIGGTHTITYSVTVNNPDNGDGLLKNTVFTPPGVGNCSAGSTDPTCSTLTPVQAYRVVKTSTASTVTPGEVVPYTITVTNTGEVAYTAGDPATFTDSLANVLDDATYNNDATSGATYAAPTISWSGPLAVGATVTITYSVTVNTPDTGDKVLKNAVVTGSTGNCSATSTDPSCAVQVPTKAFDVVKTASSSTTTPGATVTYTIVVTNTGATGYTAGAPASFTDSLTGVLDDATYNNDASNGAVYAAPTLSWSGALPVGASETITYSVTINSPDGGDHVLNNAVLTPVGSGGNCTADTTDPDCAVNVPVQSYTTSKTVSTASTTEGSRVTYTVLVTNTGDVDYTVGAPATFTDNLTSVLDDATYNNDATNGATYAAPTLSWAGTLPVGGSQTVSYSVTVNSPDTGNHTLHNTVVPTGSGGTCATPGGCATTTLVQSYTVTKSASSTTTTPGATVSYTLTVTNTGAVAYTAANPATFNDSLASVLDDATYNNDATNSATYASPTLSWAGALTVGGTQTITYSVTVGNPDPGDHILTNTVAPTASGGTCTTPGACTTNTPVASYTVAKSASTATATPGATVTYTLLVTNTGQVAYTPINPATIADSLSGVLDDATYNNDATGGATFASPTLSWSGSLAIGGTQTITYTVTVKDPDTGDNVLRNTVAATGSGGVCASALACRTVTLIASYTVSKTASTVSATPGGTVRYTVTVTNTGQVAYIALKPAAFTDDLTAVLDDATYNNDASNSATYAAPTVSWSGALPVGATQTITYSVTVNSPDSGDHLLTNSVTPTASGGDCSSPGACTTTSTVASYTVAKSASAAVVAPGATVMYTILVSNTGQFGYTAATPATFTDNLSGVLDDATYNNDASGGATYAAPTISWSGALAVGATKTITYTVTVKNPDNGDHLLKNTVFTPLGVGNCPTGSVDPSCSTVTLVQSYRAVKTSTATTANPGDVVPYTITITNTGQVAYTVADPATFVDNLTNVVDDATYDGDATAGVTFDGTSLSWSGALAVGASVSFTYTVTVNNPDAGDQILKNAVVTGSTGNCFGASTDPSCAVQVPTPAFHVVKTASSTTTTPGATVTYTIVVTNTGATDYTAGTPASFTDNLSAVLDDATYNNDATDGAVYTAPSLAWSGPLAVGQSETFTYSVTVKSADNGDHSLDNSVLTPVGSGGNCTVDTTDPDCAVHVPVQSYAVAKTASTTSTLEGGTVTYTVVVTNTGVVDYTPAAPATFTDNLSNVLDDATYNNDATGGATYVAPMLSWAGALPIGGSAAITYSVMVNTPDSGDHLLKNTVVTPTGNCVTGSTDPTCSVTVPVQSFHVTKVANTATAHPGGVIRYTITVTNTGQVPFTVGQPASFGDDLTNVLKQATYDNDADSGAAYTAPTIHWAGALPVGGVVVVKYSVRLPLGASTGETLLNTVITPEDPAGRMSNCLTGDTDPACAANVTVTFAPTDPGSAKETAYTGVDIMPPLLWALAFLMAGIAIALGIRFRRRS